MASSLLSQCVFMKWLTACVYIHVDSGRKSDRRGWSPAGKPARVMKDHRTQVDSSSQPYAASVCPPANTGVWHGTEIRGWTFEPITQGPDQMPSCFAALQGHILLTRMLSSKITQVLAGVGCRQHRSRFSGRPVGYSRHMIFTPSFIHMPTFIN